MNKKILAIMIAAALLQGCASYRQLESTRKEAVAEQQRAREMMSDLRTRTPVVKESSRQWINPRPVMDKNTGKTVPGCHSYPSEHHPSAGGSADHGKLPYSGTDHT
ncbi:hypothetical protein BH203_004457 [Escherichia coli]|nr:hypothetical protein [Escherichia coli]